METKRDAIGAIKQMRAAAQNLDKQDRPGIEDPMKLFKINGDRGSLVAGWPTGLTERKREVIRLVGQGLSNKDIAYRLSISDSTVRHHLTSIFGKVGVSNRQKLLVYSHHVRSAPD
jgi:DNA-binding NarL/FixJ family response regulator